MKADADDRPLSSRGAGAHPVQGALGYVDDHASGDRGGPTAPAGVDVAEYAGDGAPGRRRAARGCGVATR